ncbi:hypothetical protein [Nocardioides sp. SYSU D00038]|uniref:hypothetical protein n=1 Tax=Nocardioides sp. SYSU D00038 TaxID=2812554 RepID=UPI0019683718|nr:hypothetical protein [Nocardioides sp. SYSU D00038]
MTGPARRRVPSRWVAAAFVVLGLVVGTWLVVRALSGDDSDVPDDPGTLPSLTEVRR